MMAEEEREEAPNKSWIEETWHTLEADQVTASLHTSPKGLAHAAVAERLKEFGQNKVAQKKRITPLVVFLRQFKSPIIYILLFAALTSLFIGKHIEFYVIGTIVLFVVILSFLEEYKASRALEALMDLTPRMTRVRREGKESDIPSDDVVPGDVLLLGRGDIVPADARIIECNNLQADESSLTGESNAVLKRTTPVPMDAPIAERTCMVFGSSKVTNGNGIAIAVKTGKHSEIGKISSMLGEVEEETTPLQKRIDKLSKQITGLIIVIAILVAFAGALRGTSWDAILLLAIAVTVSGVPESLPTVIAVTLALGVKRIAGHGAIIKRMPAVETLGTCTVICTDKTGTLTQNRMVVEKLYTLGVETQVTGEGFDPEGLFLLDGKTIDPKKDKTLAQLLEIGALCNNANLSKTKEGWEIEGEATEGAFVVLAKKAGMEKHALMERSPRIKEFPFDPERKRMSTIHLIKKRRIVYTKGAPETLLHLAKHHALGGKTAPMTAAARKAFLMKTETYAKQGMRVIGLAYKEYRRSTYDLKRVETDLVFVGLAAIRDPPAANVKDAIKECAAAGTKVVMITGDNRITAEAIAKDLGIYRTGDLILDGPELEAMSDEEFAAKVNAVTVYARATPNHKLRIVTALQAKGHVVAMTGDGVNDAPALKKADIGIAMGKRGTEVAKESAEMVITDDNFATIVTAIEQGRTIYANIRKFIYYLLAGNISEVTLVLLAVLLGINPPLTALMVLFINIVTSDLPAMGMSVERASRRTMRQRPRDPKEGILSEYLLFRIVQTVPLFVLGTIALFMWELIVQGGTLEKAQTMAFATIITFELFHVFNAKSWDESAFSKKSFNNPYLTGGVAMSIALTLTVIYFPPAQAIFGTVALSLSEFGAILAMGSSVLFINEILKAAINAELREREQSEISPQESEPLRTH